VKILITNDDGINSDGLNALVSALSDHEVWVVAPDRERSASSQSITIKDPVRIHKLGERIYTCSGTPADCVVFSLNTIIETMPDMILSGINHGTNLGIDLLYSGTAAAARQGALAGIPSIALSQCSNTPPFYFDRGAAFLAQNLVKLKELWHKDHFININIPNISEGVLEAKITTPSQTRYIDRISSFTAPNEDLLCLLNGERGAGDEDGHDFGAVDAGFVSISPVYLFPVNHREEEAYRKAEFKKLS